MLEGKRQKLLGNAFRGWNPDWLSGGDGQKGKIVAAEQLSGFDCAESNPGIMTNLKARSVYIPVSCAVRTPPLRQVLVIGIFICPRSKVGVRVV